jgi:hypothetical protein
MLGKLKWKWKWKKNAAKKLRKFKILQQKKKKTRKGTKKEK